MVQLQCLNRILSSGDGSFITKNGLTEEHFSEYPNEYRFIKSHMDAYGKVPDLATFLGVFNSFEVINVSETDEYLLKALVDDFRTRKLASTFNGVKSKLLVNDVQGAIDLARDAIEGGGMSDTSFKCVDILRDTTRYNEYLDRTRDLSKYFVSTGFAELDSVLGGFDRRDELATIVARTNVGKTWCLIKCALASAQEGLNVGIYSGEMSESRIGGRIDTLLSHISNGAINHGNVSCQKDYEAYFKNLPNMVKGTMKVITPAMLNGPATVSSLRAFIERENLDILFIDQLSLLEDQRHGRSSPEKFANISKDLQLLQRIKKIPIISVSQQNRTTTESGNVDTTQIAQSDRIGQDSTLVIFVEKKDDTMKMTVVKSRNSSNGHVFNYNVNLDRGEFTYIPTEDDGIGGSSVPSDYADRYEREENGDVF